jgi:hypothetical protein
LQDIPPSTAFTSLFRKSLDKGAGSILASIPACILNHVRSLLGILF